MRVRGVCVGGGGVVLGDVWVWKDVGGVGSLGRFFLWGLPLIWIVRRVLQWGRYRVLTVEISDNIMASPCSNT